MFHSRPVGAPQASRQIYLQGCCRITELNCLNLARPFKIDARSPNRCLSSKLPEMFKMTFDLVRLLSSNSNRIQRVAYLSRRWLAWPVRPMLITYSIVDSLEKCGRFLVLFFFILFAATYAKENKRWSYSQIIKLLSFSS